MRIVAWLTPGTWQVCVDATAQVAPPDADIALLVVDDPALGESVRGAHAGLVGRAGWRRDPGATVDAVTRSADEALLAASEARLGRRATRDVRRGRPEHEVIAAAADAWLLVVARDGDHTRLGPHSLGRATRFVIDHAPCRVLLVWPDEPPSLDTIPPPPPPGRGRHGPPEPLS